MADMITRCPQCATAFRITAAHLKLAQGSVRCGACFTIFNALENLSERATHNTPVSNLADDFLISDHMGIEEIGTDDETVDAPIDNVAKSSLFERVELAKAAPDKTDDADESWALALLNEEDPGQLQANDDEFIEEEPSFRPFQLSPDDKPIELSDAFLKATLSNTEPSSTPQIPASTVEVGSTTAPIPATPAVSGQRPNSAEVEIGHTLAGTGNEDKADDEDFATTLAKQHPELNANALKELQHALHQTLTDPAKPAAAASNNAHLIERIELEPLEVTFRQRKGLTPRFWWSLGGALALLVLLGQVLIIKMPQWRYDTPLSGAYALACKHLNCPLASRVDASKIHTKSLLVREHPSVPGALAVDTVIINKASFTQPFPRLILSFRNLQNQLVQERVFLPTDYLGGEMAGETTMPIKQEIHISLEILDPGKEAVSYNLSIDN